MRAAAAAASTAKNPGAPVVRPRVPIRSCVLLLLLYAQPGDTVRGSPGFHAIHTERRFNAPAGYLAPHGRHEGRQPVGDMHHVVVGPSPHCLREVALRPNHTRHLTIDTLRVTLIQR